MKKLAIGLVLVPVIALGGYSFLWNQKAGELKLLVEDGIKKGNEASKPFTESAELIKYESITASGWPLNIVLNINKPVVTFPVHALAQTLNDKKNLGLDAPPITPEKPAVQTKWIETISYDTIQLGTNIATDSFSLSFPGDQSSVTQYNGQITNERIASSASAMTCTMKILPKASGFFDVKGAFGDPKDMGKQFRSLDCEGRGLNTTDAKSKEALQSIESMAFGFSFDGSNTSQSKGGLYAKVVNQKATKAFDKQIEGYMAMISKTFMMKEEDAVLFGTPLSEYGNNNMDINITFNGPTDPVQYLSKDMLLNFSINKFSIQNDLAKSDFEMHIKSNPAQDASKRDSAFVMRSNSAFTERYDQMKLSEVTKMAEQFLKSEEADMKDLRASLKDFTPEDIKLAISELWPRFHPLGNISLAIDVAANTSNPFSTSSGELTVNNLDFVTALDGIKISGKGVQKGLMPEGEVKITCLSCEGLLARAYAYIKVVDKWATKMDEKHEVTVSEELYNGFKSFLKSISVAAKDGTGKEVPSDWFYHIQMTADKEPTLNGKSMMQVMESFGQNVAPNLPNHAAKESEDENSPASTYSPDEKVEPNAKEEE